jgi:hypothetical protein
MLARADAARLPQQRPPPERFYNHMPLREVIARCAEDLSGFRVVCVARSPYAKVLSWLNMTASISAYASGGDMRSDAAGLRIAFDRAARNGRIGAVRNIDLYRALDGALPADILRYETLQADFVAFLGGLGIATPPALPHAKKGLMSNDLDPRAILQRDQIDAINDVYADEFETFGYARL